MGLSKATGSCLPDSGNFRFLFPIAIGMGANHADLHIQKLKSGKAKGNYLSGKSHGRQILMNVFILLFAAVLKDKTGMWQGNYFSEPFVFII